MKTKQKNKVIAVLASHPRDPKLRYKALVAQLLELDGSTPGQKRFYNASIYSPVNLKSIEYDIQQLCGITDREVKKVVMENKTPAPKTGQERLLEFNPEGDKDYLKQEAIDLVEFSKLKLPEPLPKFSKGYPGNVELKKWLADKEVTHNFTKKLDLQALIEKEHQNLVDNSYAIAIDNLKAAKEALLKEFDVKLDEETEVLKTQFSEALASADDDVKTGLKIRDLYPFLNNDDCPDEFHTLTGKMVSAYINWKEGRKELKALLEAGVSNEEIYEIAKKVVDDYQLNLDCHDELTYYQEHGEILGNHPIFAEQMLQEKVNAMGQVDLVNRKKNLASYISRDKKAFNKMVPGEARDNFQLKIKEWEDEQKLVLARLEKITGSQKL